MFQKNKLLITNKILAEIQSPLQKNFFHKAFKEKLRETPHIVPIIPH